MSAGAQTSQLELLTCAMCGHRFDPAENIACGSCPVNSGCALVCCPACGYQAPGPKRSRLVSLGSWIARLRYRRRPTGVVEQTLTLADVPPGKRARVDTLDGLSASRCHQLQAYGLAPGRWVKVVQQSPVTVVQVEHLDLAFESDIARGIGVETATGSGPKKKLAQHPGE